MPKLNPVTPNQTRWHRAAPGDTQTAPGDAQTAHVGAHTVPGNARRRPPVTVPLTPEQPPCPHPPSPTLCLWGVCAGGGTEGSRAPSRPSALLRALPAAASPLLSLPRDSAWRGGGGFLVPSPPQEGPGPCARRHAAPSACRAGGGGEGCSEPSPVCSGRTGGAGLRCYGRGTRQHRAPHAQRRGEGLRALLPPLQHRTHRPPGPPPHCSAAHGAGAQLRSAPSPPQDPRGGRGGPALRSPIGIRRGCIASAPRPAPGSRGVSVAVSPPRRSVTAVSPRAHG